MDFLLIGLIASVSLVSHGMLADSYADQYVRLEAKIIRLENPQGLTATGMPCGGHLAPRQCNTIISAKIDITDSEEKDQNYGYYSSSANDGYKRLINKLDDNDPHIDQTISKDICGMPLEKVMVRVRVHEEGLKGHKRINDFVCETFLHLLHIHSVWSPLQLCEPEFQKRKMRLYFRYRVTRLDHDQCQKEY